MRSFRVVPNTTRILLATPPLRTTLNFVARHTMSNSISAMGKRLEGKTILITGASSGIGRSTAIEFARTSPRDLKLVIMARRLDSLKGLAADIKKEVGDGVKVHPVKMDVSDPEQVKGLVRGLPEE